RVLAGGGLEQEVRQQDARDGSGTSDVEPEVAAFTRHGPAGACRSAAEAAAAGPSPPRPAETGRRSRPRPEDDTRTAHRSGRPAPPLAETGRSVPAPAPCH